MDVGPGRQLPSASSSMYASSVTHPSRSTKVCEEWGLHRRCATARSNGVWLGLVLQGRPFRNTLLAKRKSRA